ncbi:MAG: hypothetical protein LBE85_14395 [Candidatus Accumulibacter sp.]|nr:hypothetical protein [Accumulibacter sp.]
MPQKEWVAGINGHRIRVVNTWTGGTHLYIDGERRNSNRGLFAMDWTPWLSARTVPDDPESELVEVYVKARLAVKAQIHVNGHHLAGDRA